MTLDALLAKADAYAYASRLANDRDSHTRAELQQALEEIVNENIELRFRLKKAQAEFQDSWWNAFNGIDEFND